MPHVCLKVFIYEGSGSKEETESTSKDAAHRQESRVSLVSCPNKIQPSRWQRNMTWSSYQGELPGRLDEEQGIHLDGHLTVLCRLVLTLILMLMLTFMLTLILMLIYLCWYWCWYIYVDVGTKLFRCLAAGWKHSQDQTFPTLALWDQTHVGGDPRWTRVFGGLDSRERRGDALENFEKHPGYFQARPWGDRRQELVFIGKDLNHEVISLEATAGWCDINHNDNDHDHDDGDKGIVDDDDHDDDHDNPGDPKAPGQMSPGRRWDGAWSQGMAWKVWLCW